MTAGSFSTAIVVSVCLSAALCSSHGLEVSQPVTETVRTDGSALISCDFTEDIGTVKDVRFYSISSDQSKKKMLCQKAKKYCPNVVMYAETPKKYVFVIFNVGTEAMSLLYQCEITVSIDDLDSEKRGKPTRLQAVPGPTEERPTPVTPSTPPPPFSEGPLRWILIGLLVLLALLSLYSCAISFLYNRLKKSNKDPENSTYVEMRKAPSPNNAGIDIYCG